MKHLSETLWYLTIDNPQAWGRLCGEGEDQTPANRPSKARKRLLDGLLTGCPQQVACNEDGNPIVSWLLYGGPGSQCFFGQPEGQPKEPCSLLLLQRMVERCRDPWQQDVGGMDALDAALAARWPQAIDWLLDRPGAPTKADGFRRRDGSQRQPLIEAAQIDDVDIVKVLLEKGSDPNQTDDAGGSAIRAAKSKQVLELLLDAGGDPGLTNRDGISMRSLLAASLLAASGSGAVAAAAMAKTLNKWESKRETLRPNGTAALGGGKALLGGLRDGSLARCSGTQLLGRLAICGGTLDEQINEVPFLAVALLSSTATAVKEGLFYNRSKLGKLSARAVRLMRGRNVDNISMGAARLLLGAILDSYKSAQDYDSNTVKLIDLCGKPNNVKEWQIWWDTVLDAAHAGGKVGMGQATAGLELMLACAKPSEWMSALKSKDEYGRTRLWRLLDLAGRPLYDPDFAVDGRPWRYAYAFLANRYQGLNAFYDVPMEEGTAVGSIIAFASKEDASDGTASRWTTLFDKAVAPDVLSGLSDEEKGRFELATRLEGGAPYIMARVNAIKLGMRNSAKRGQSSSRRSRC